jgi:hypothetical protein
LLVFFGVLCLCLLVVCWWWCVGVCFIKLKVFLGLGLRVSFVVIF